VKLRVEIRVNKALWVVVKGDNNPVMHHVFLSFQLALSVPCDNVACDVCDVLSY
jgi:hypothetical protein